MAVSGGSCLAAACFIPGSIANRIAPNPPQVSEVWTDLDMSAENPAGGLDMTVTARSIGGVIAISRAGYRRSAQVLIKGYVPLYHASSALQAAIMEEET